MNGIRKGDIYYIEKTISTGCEITTTAPARPAVIVSSDRGNEISGTVQVVYLTSAPRNESELHIPVNDHTANLKMMSTTICEQITCVSKERVGNYIGKVTPATMKKIERGILAALGIDAVDVAAVEDNEEIELLKMELEAKEAELAKAKRMAEVFKGMADHLMNQIIDNN